MSAIDAGAGGAPIIVAPVLTSLLPGDGQVTAAWSAVVGATGYDLYHGTETGVSKIGGTKIVGVTSPRIVSGLTNEVEAFVVVVAFDTESESDVSFELSATPSAGDLRAIGGGLSGSLSGGL